MEEKRSLLKAWLLLGSVLYPSWSILIYYFFPGGFDLPYQRLLVSIIYISTLVLERYSKFVRKYFEVIAYVLVFLITTHYYYLTYLADFSHLYQIGIFIVAGTTSFTFMRRNLAFINSLYSTFLLLLIGLNTSVEKPILIIILSGVVTIHIISFMILYVNHRLSEEIEKQRVDMTNSSRLAALGEMAGGIAHEVNNPLAIIHGNIAKMKRLKRKDMLTDEEFNQVTENILKVVDRIVNIISSLKKFARDGDNSQFSEENLYNIVQEVIQLTSEKLKHLNIKVENIKPDWEPIITCREVQISQVLFNLFSNSIDALESHESKWIKIQYYKDQDKITMTFTDSGNGIDRKLTSKILEPFFTTKPVGKGTGLGLSISHSIMQEHQGNIELNTQSKHTEFKLHFCQKSKE